MFISHSYPSRPIVSVRKVSTIWTQVGRYRLRRLQDHKSHPWFQGMRGLGSTSVRPQGRVGSGLIIFFIDFRVSCRRFGSLARSYLPLLATYWSSEWYTRYSWQVVGMCFFFFFHSLLFNMLTMYYLASWLSVGWCHCLAWCYQPANWIVEAVGAEDEWRSWIGVAG